MQGNALEEEDRITKSQCRITEDSNMVPIYYGPPEGFPNMYFSISRSCVWIIFGNLSLPDLECRFLAISNWLQFCSCQLLIMWIGGQCVFVVLVTGSRSSKNNMRLVTMEQRFHLPLNLENQAREGSIFWPCSMVRSRSLNSISDSPQAHLSHSWSFKSHTPYNSDEKYKIASMLSLPTWW